MPTSSDSDLRAKAEASLAQAEALLTGPSPVLVGAGGDYWSDVADRARAMLKRAVNAPLRSGIQVGGKLRDAAQAGLDKASDASAGARSKLAAVALGAGALAIAPLLILLGLPLVLGESTGFGPRARRAGRRYVERRAREIGF